MFFEVMQKEWRILNGKSPGYGAYLCIILSVGVFSAGLPYIADFENLYAVYTIFGIAACLTAAAIFRVVRRCCYLRALSGAFLPKEYEGVSKASLVWGKGAALSLFGICLFLPWMAILLCLDQLDPTLEQWIGQTLAAGTPVWEIGPAAALTAMNAGAFCFKLAMLMIALAAALGAGKESGSRFWSAACVLLSAALLAVGALESKGQLLLWQELFSSGNLLILRALLDLALNLLLGWLLGKWAVRRASLYSF